MITLLTILTTISLSLPQTITISGTVTDTGGTALAGTAVQLEKGVLPITTGTDE